MPKTLRDKPKANIQSIGQEVIRATSSINLDFEFINGCLYLCITNLTDESYLEVHIKSKQKIHCVNDVADARQLSIFNGISYLSPRKRIAVFLDHVDIFFQHQEELQLSFTIQYQNTEGKSLVCSITHNLAIYKDLPIQSSTTRI